MDESLISAVLERFTTEIRKEIHSVKDDLNKTLKEIKEQQSQTTNTVKNQGLRISYLEREVKKKNIIIFGIIENKPETSERLENEVLNLINNNLTVELQYSDIDDVHRIGKYGNENRPICLKLVSYRKKSEIMNQKKSLKGRNIYLDDDYPVRERETRKLLITKLKEAREQGKFAILRYDKLIVRDFAPEHSKKENRPKRRISALASEISPIKDSISKRMNNKALVQAPIKNYVEKTNVSEAGISTHQEENTKENDKEKQRKKDSTNI